MRWSLASTGELWDGAGELWDGPVGWPVELFVGPGVRWVVTLELWSGTVRTVRLLLHLHRA